MPFTFKLYDPPCDVAFLSIVDGETLYNADNKHTRDLKEATIRQIGWHRIALPQDWFLSEKALQTTQRMLEAIQCTVQYLKHLCKNEEKRSLKLTNSLQHCEEERAAAFEELIELRETIVLYKKKLRELNENQRRGAAAAARASRTPAAVQLDGLQCAFCENVYPSRHALESHFRKRHKRSAGYAAMAAASAAVGQQHAQQEREQEKEEREQQQTVLQRVPSNLPFMNQGPSPQLQLTATTTTAVANATDSRGDRSLREELSELRLTVAKLLTQQAEFYRGMSPSNTAAVPVSSAAMPVASVPAFSRVASPTTTPTARGEAESGPLPGLLSTAHGGDESANVVLRILRERLHTSAALQLLQDALNCADEGGGKQSEKGTDKPSRGRISSSPPRDLTPRPTLDPRSIMRSSASDSANGGGGVVSGEALRGSTADSLVEVSPMSPPPSMAQHGHRGEDGDKSSNHRRDKNAAAAGFGGGRGVITHRSVTGFRNNAGALGASLETQGPTEKHGKRRTDTSLHSSAHTLTAVSAYGSVRDGNDLTASSNDRVHLGQSHTPPGRNYNTIGSSADSAQLSAHGPDSDSPIVRLPSSTDAKTHASSLPNSPSANRYGPLPDSEDVSQIMSNGPSGGTASRGEAQGTIYAQYIQPAPGSYQPKVLSAWSALKKQVAATGDLLKKKNYGPVPSAPILRSPSCSSGSLPPTKVRESNASPRPHQCDPKTNAGHCNSNNNVNRHNDNNDDAASAALRRGPPEPSSAIPRDGVRSPTKTSRRGSTPPTSRVTVKTQVPALNLNSVSPHTSADQPPRCVSPYLGCSHTRHGDNDGGVGNTAEEQRTSASAADVVMHGSLNSTSAVLQSNFTQAIQAPTQKTIPVVRLVPQASSGSAELAQYRLDEEEDNDDVDNDASTPSFTHVGVHEQQPFQRAANASYSVKAHHCNLSDMEEEEDVMNVGLNEVFSSNSSGSLREDIAVDRVTDASSHLNSNTDNDKYKGGDAVMEDVLTDDMVQAPVFCSALVNYPPPTQQESVPGTASEREDEDEEGRGEVEYGFIEDDQANSNKNVKIPHRNAQDPTEGSSDNKSNGTREEEERGERKDADENNVSSDYSYYTYSYSDDAEGKDAEGEEGGEKTINKDYNRSTELSLSTLGVSPPMAVSPTSVAASPRGGDGKEAGFTYAAEESHEDGGCPIKASQKKEKKRTITSATATANPHGGARAYSGLPRACKTELTGSEQVASIYQTHDSSFQSHVSHTMKKAGVAFKSLFVKSKK